MRIRKMLMMLVLAFALLAMSAPAMANDADGMTDYGVTPQSVTCDTPGPWSYIGSYCKSAACWFRPQKGDYMDRYRRAKLCCDSVSGECHYQYEYKDELVTGCSCTP